MYGCLHVFIPPIIEEAKDMRSESWDKQRAIMENYRRETEDMPAARLAGKLVDMEDEFGIVLIGGSIMSERKGDHRKPGLSR